MLLTPLRTCQKRGWQAGSFAPITQVRQGAAPTGGGLCADGTAPWPCRHWVGGQGPAGAPGSPRSLLFWG